MIALCIDTATEHGAIAVARSGDVLSSATWRSSARHGENLFGHIDSVLMDAELTRADLDLVAASIGPGKFTSLRVGLSTAKGIALGLELPIIGLGSLPVLARTPTRENADVVVALMNAYRGDLFGAAYQFVDDSLEEVVAPGFGAPAQLLSRIRAAVGDRLVGFCGEGTRSQAAALDQAFALEEGALERAPVAPSPAALAAEVDHAIRTRDYDDLATLEPKYLRPSDATLPDKPLLVRE